MRHPSSVWVLTNRCLAPMLRHLLHHDDDEVALKRKRLLLVLHLCVLVVSSVMFPIVVSTYTKTACGLTCATAILSLLHLAATKKATDASIVAGVSVYTAGIILFDFAAAVVMQARTWPIFVVLLDILLVCKVRQLYTLSLLGVIVVWLFVTAIEGQYRYGLYDLPGTVGKADRNEYLRCESPPCGTDAFVVGLVPQLLILGLDLYFTRGFAEAVLEEKEKVDTAIETAKDVAHSLSVFDLDRARSSIAAAENLPPELRSAFQHLLNNLHAYRPYLSDALFHTLHHSPSGALSLTAPPGDNGSAAIVFTDIEGSTAIWEACPHGMKKGLAIHNDIIRECLAEHNGYEVKTIGDAFMVAFGSVVDACCCGLAMQERLDVAKWPHEFATVAGAKDGLRIRVGINYGSVQVEANAVTSRFDYFGKSVNKAARVEGYCAGGAVAITREVLEELHDTMPDEPSTLPTSDRTYTPRLPEQLDNPLTMTMEDVPLKGVTGEQEITILIPKKLAGRRQRVAMELKRKETQARPTGDARLGTPFSSSADTSARSDETSIRVEDVTGSQDFLRGRLEVATLCTAGRVEIRHAVDEDQTYDPETLLVYINDGLERVFHCLQRSGGATVALLGSCVAMAWNTVKRCDTHLESAVRFVAYLHDSNSRYDYHPTFHAGLATGSLLHGNIGGHSQRFTTTIGPVATLAGLLSTSAVDLGVSCLFGVTHNSDKPSNMFRGLKGWIRPVDEWDVAHQGHSITVYQIRVADIMETPFLTMITRDEEDREAFNDIPWCWSNAYWTAFYKRHFDAGVVASPAFLADRVASSVRDMLHLGTHLRCAVVF